MSTHWNVDMSATSASGPVAKPPVPVRNRIFDTSRRHFLTDQCPLASIVIPEEWEQFLGKLLAIGNSVIWAQEKQALEAVLYENDEGYMSAWEIYNRMPSTIMLNDTLMVGYLSVLKKGFNVPRSVSYLEYFNSQFIDWCTEHLRYPKEQAKDERSLLREARMQKFIDGDSLRKYNWLLIPVEKEHHWTVIIVDIVDKHINQYDSLGSASTMKVDPKPRMWTPLNVIVKWVAGIIGEETWWAEKWCYKRVKLPEQTNFSDCGVWCLIACRMILAGFGGTMLCMRQESKEVRAAFVEEWRWRIAAELVAGRLKPKKEDIPALPSLPHSPHLPPFVMIQRPMSQPSVQGALKRKRDMISLD